MCRSKRPTIEANLLLEFTYSSTTKKLLDCSVEISKLILRNIAKYSLRAYQIGFEDILDCEEVKEMTEKKGEKQCWHQRKMLGD